MDLSIFLSFLLFLSPILFLLLSKKTSSKRLLPPGSLGIPIIGQSLNLLKAMRSNKSESWFDQRIAKYGPIFKLNLFGTRTVFLSGQAANKFIYTCDDKILANQQPASIRRLLGDRNLIELSGNDHKRVRGALVTFLKPEALRQSVGRIDEEIKMHIKKYWHGKKEMKVTPHTKILTFDVICSLMFGVERGMRRTTLIKLFENLVSGTLAVPINLPFTQFNKSLHSRKKIREIILELIHEKRAKLDRLIQPQDLITSLLGMYDETNAPSLSDEEIVDNCILMMLAGHDTTSALLTFLVKLLAEDPIIYNSVLNEQEDISKGKTRGEALTWDDLSKMKYTWRVATEILRVTPPVIFSFRKVLKDFEYGGYLIPKRWQVMWAMCTTHMDESIFPAPSKINPSRFENDTKAPPFSFVAFGGGPRMCPGYEFARIESLTLIHYLVTGFEWKLYLQDNFLIRNPMPTFIKELPLQIREIKKPRSDEM